MNPTVQDVIDIAQKTMFTAVLLSMPVLLTSLIVGVFISLIQTVTSVQEMTITFVPKLIAVMGVTLLALSWMIQVIVEYTEDLWASMSLLSVG